MINPAQAYRIRKRIPKLLFRLCVPLALIFFLFFVNRFSLVIIPQGETEAYIEVGSSYEDPGITVKLQGTLILKSGLDVDAEITTQNSVDTSELGAFQLRYDASFLNLESSFIRTIRVRDSKAPKITLVSKPGTYTLPGTGYEEEGFSAWDAYEGDLTQQVIRQERDGFVHYQVSDSSGNTTCISRKIRYLDPVPPEIQLAGASELHLKAGTPYEEPGWTAQDNCDGDLSDQVRIEGTVDIYQAGTYELTYQVQDRAGNAAKVTRIIVVEPLGPMETVIPPGKVIYLTFDDGPGPYTRQLLDILDAYNVKATFFVINSDYAYLIEEIAARGHALGVHSVSHDYREIYASSEAFMEDLLSMQEIIRQYSGITTYLMRFPGGSSNTVSRFNKGIMTRLTQAVGDMGFRYFDWNVDSNDAGGARESREVFENVTEGVQRQQVSVVLQHDIKDFSVEAVENILIWGLENGYTFLPLNMSSPTAQHDVNN